MGFFKPPKTQEAEVSDNAYEDDYVSKAIRIPSSKDTYVNEEFDTYFTMSKSQSFNRTKSRRHTFFTKLFKKVPNINANDDVLPLGERRQKESSTAIRIIEREVQSDEASDSEFNLSRDEDLKPEKSISLLTWRRKRNKNQSLSREKAPTETLTKRASIRYFFSREKEIEQEALEVEQAPSTSTVYDVRETLTQRYMTHSGEGYERLMDDLDYLPLEFSNSSNEPPTLHKKVSRLFHSLSPLRKSPKSSSTQSKDDGSQIEHFNPYDIAKNYKKKNETFGSTNEVDDNTHKSEDCLISRKASLFNTFRKSLSVRRKSRIIEKPLSEDQDGNDDAKPSLEPPVENSTEHFVEPPVDTHCEVGREEYSSIRRRFSKKLDIRSKRLPSFSNFESVDLDEEETPVREGSRRVRKRSNNVYESNFEPFYNDDSVDHSYPFSSGSSTVYHNSAELFDKLYSKSLDAAELKDKFENEDLSGSTKVHVSIVNTGELIPKLSSESSVGGGHNLISNFAPVDNTTNFNTQRVSSFLQTYYEPPRSSTTHISRNPSQGLQGDQRAIKLNHDVTTDLGEEVKISRPLTAVEQYNKDVEKNRLEMEDLKHQILRHKSHHRKVLNGKLDP